MGAGGGGRVKKDCREAKDGVRLETEPLRVKLIKPIKESRPIYMLRLLRGQAMSSFERCPGISGSKFVEMDSQLLLSEIEQEIKQRRARLPWIGLCSTFNSHSLVLYLKTLHLEVTISLFFCTETNADVVPSGHGQKLLEGGYYVNWKSGK